MKPFLALLLLSVSAGPVYSDITQADAAPTSEFFRGISGLGINDEAGKASVKTMMDHIAKGTQGSPAALAVLRTSPPAFRAYFLNEQTRREGAEPKAADAKFPPLGGEWKIVGIDQFNCSIMIDPATGRIKGDAIDEWGVEFSVSGKLDAKTPLVGSLQLIGVKDRKSVRDYLLEVVTPGGDPTFRITRVKNGGLVTTERFEMARLTDGTLAERRKQQKELLKIIK